MAKPLIVKFSRYLHEEIPDLDLSLVHYRALQAYKWMCDHFGVEEPDRDCGLCFTLRGPVETVLASAREQLSDAARTNDPKIVTRVLNELLPDLFSMSVERDDDAIFIRIQKSEMEASEIDPDDKIEVVASAHGEELSRDDVLTLRLAYAPRPIEHLFNMMYRNGDESDKEAGAAGQA